MYTVLASLLALTIIVALTLVIPFGMDALKSVVKKIVSPVVYIVYITYVGIVTACERHAI